MQKERKREKVLGSWNTAVGTALQRGHTILSAPEQWFSNQKGAGTPSGLAEVMRDSTKHVDMHYVVRQFTLVAKVAHTLFSMPAFCVYGLLAQLPRCTKKL